MKGYKAKGKRLTTYALDTVNELEPTKKPTEDAEATVVEEDVVEEENLDPDKDKSDSDIMDELTGQGRLF